MIGWTADELTKEMRNGKIELVIVRARIFNYFQKRYSGKIGVRNMKRFAVGYMDYGDNNLEVIIIDAIDWKDAIMVHPKYPYRQQYQDGDKEPIPATPISELIARYPDLSEEEAVKQCCFDCDCLMGWIEIDELTSPATVLQ